MRWASQMLGTPPNEVIAAVRTGITVESIATPRSMVQVRERVNWQSIKGAPELTDFDRVPVTEDDQIVGVYDRKSDTLKDLSETMFMASEASLLNFIENADYRQFAFLVRESQIVGIVTLSDIQKLPVYCVLYSLLISVEMLLMELIRMACKDESEKWMNALDKQAKRNIEDHWEKSLQENLALDRLSCASFGNELSAAEYLDLISPDESAILKRLKGLRDLVSHGTEIALTPERAFGIPVLVREALQIQVALEERLKGMSG